MGIPSTAWDETNPAGTRSIKLGDNDIRAMKTQVREVIAVDHEFTSTQTDATGGQHKQVTLQEQADLGTGAVGACILGSQTINGKGELVYTDEDDNDIQLTDNGVIAGITAAVVNALVYPVGAIFTAGVSTNPATLLGVGTWTAITGTVIVGIAGSGTFDTLDATGGAETHALIEAELAAHTHTVATQTTTNGGGAGDIYHSNASSTGTKPTSSVGSGTAHNNLQPYIVKYVWQRTA